MTLPTFHEAYSNTYTDISLTGKSYLKVLLDSIKKPSPYFDYYISTEMKFQKLPISGILRKSYNYGINIL